MDKFELLCLLEAISNYAYDIHYTAKGRYFFSDHLFSERLSDVDVKDDFIETFYLGKSEEAPASADIARKVATLTPQITDNTQDNFKRLRDLIIRALMTIQKYDGTKGEEDILGAIAHILQRHNGLLYRQLTYTPEEIRNDNSDWRDIVSEEDTTQTLENEKILNNGFITVDAGTENERVIWVSYLHGMSKEARERISKIMSNFSGETNFDFSHTKAQLTDEQKNEIKETFNSVVKEYDFKPVAQVEVVSDATSGAYGVCTSSSKNSVVSLSSGLFNGRLNQEEYNKDVNSGFHPQGTGDSVKSVMMHELGHAITVNSNNTEFWNKIETIRKDYMKNVTKEDTKNVDFISNYARMNNEEFVAEAFCQGKLAKTFGKYTRLVMEQIDKHFKKGYQHNMFDNSKEKDKKINPDDLWVENYGLGYPTEEAYNRWKERTKKEKPDE